MMNEEYFPQLQSLQYQYESKGLKINLEQAKAIFSMEEIKDLYPSNHFFSKWEEWDYERFALKDILTSEQYTIYEKKLSECILQYQQSLIEQDKAFEQNIAYSKELLAYHELNIFPILSVFPAKLHLGLLGMDSKIEYLKKEYALFLQQSKKEILINHFRQNRTFKPFELKSRILQHQIDYLLPNYNHFKSQMDYPTTTVSEFIYSELPEKLYEAPYSDSDSESIYKRLENWRNDLYIIRNKYFPESIKGWHTTIESQPRKEEMKSFHMSLLLVDKDGYSLNA